jgi:hypothetical protein
MKKEALYLKRITYWAIIFSFLAVLVRLAFWIYTDRTWEDALITVLHSENAVSGLGLTHYNIGQPPVHGFTSPISALIPLVGDLIHLGFGLSLIKIVSIMSGGLAVLYMAVFAGHPKVKLPIPLAVLLMGYVAFEPQQISFGMSGLETQIATTILLAFLYYLMVWKPKAIGILLGLSFFVRPEYIFLTGIVGIIAIIKRKHLQSPDLKQIIFWPIILYTPWLIFTTLYYGSPIPNSMRAKSIGYVHWVTDPKVGFGAKATTAFLLSKNTLFTYLSPAFAGHGTGYAPMPDRHIISLTMTALSIIGCIYIIRKRKVHLYGYVFYLIFYSIFYLFLTPALFSWYQVPFSAVTLILSVEGIRLLYKKLGRSSLKPVWIGSFLYVAIFIAMIPVTFEAQRGIQTEIEDKVRKQIGLYLKSVMSPSERVGTESLGYIGYYCRCAVLDWPGFANREVSAYAQTLPREKRSMQESWKHFRPEYLVVRPSEYEKLKLREGDNNFIDNNYRLEKVFEADQEKVRQIPYYWMNIDTKFLVFKRIY